MSDATQREAYREAVDRLDGYHRSEALETLREIGDPAAIEPILEVLVEQFDRPAGDRMAAFVDGAWGVVGELWESDAHAEVLYETLRRVPRHFRAKIGWERPSRILRVVARVDQPWAADVLRVYASTFLFDQHEEDFRTLLEEAGRDLDEAPSGGELRVVTSHANPAPSSLFEMPTVGRKAALVARPLVMDLPGNRFHVAAGDEIVQFGWWPQEGDLQLVAELPVVEHGEWAGAYAGPVDDEEADRAIEDLAEHGRQPEWLREKLAYFDELPRKGVSAGRKLEIPPEASWTHSREAAHGKAQAAPSEPEETPSDLDELEALASREPTSVTPGDHDRLARHYWKRAKRADGYRERRKHFKRAGFFAGHAVEQGMEKPERLESYRLMLEAAAEVSMDTGGLRRTQALVRTRLADLRGGLGEYTVLDGVFGEIRIGGGLLVVADLDELPDEPGFDDESHVEWMSEGRVLSLSAGGAGIFPVELRLVDGHLPRLAPGELRAMDRCTSAVTLRASSGRIGFGGLPIPRDERLLAGPSDAWIEMEVAPAGLFGRLSSVLPGGRRFHLNACVYGLPDRYIAVVGHTDASPPNDVRSLEEL